MGEPAPEFTLPNAGPGPDPYTLGETDAAFVVLFFQRDDYCTNCREQVRTLADNVEAFRERGAEIVSILPEPLATAAEWQERYDLPYPLLADPDASVGEAYEQPVRFGFLGEFSDFLGRMPVVAVIDCRGEGPEVVATHRGSSTFDRPDVAEVLAMIDDARGD
jgi:peroxiredoxin Q/BCP